MDSSDRMVSIVWGFVMTALVTAIFFISSCVNNGSVLDAKTKQACIAARGNWALVTGSNTYGCQFNK